MPKADSYPNPNLTLSALAAQLGPAEAPRIACDKMGENDDITHAARLRVLAAASRCLPVRSAEDAALALSIVNDLVCDARDNELSEDQRYDMLTGAECALVLVVRWLHDEHGATPLYSCFGADEIKAGRA